MSTNSNIQRKMPSGLIALKKIVEGTSGHTGQDFFRHLVKNLSETLDAHGVWVTEYLRESNRLNSLAFWLKDHFVEHYEYDVPGTPCEPVLESEGICHVPDRVIQLYPKDPDLPPLGAVSYMGLALRDENQKVLGHLALLDNKPMAEIPEAFAIFTIFASRAAAEMRRLRYESLLLENEAKLKRLVNGTHEIMIEVNQHLIITQANQASRENFRSVNAKFTGKNLKDIFNAESFQILIRHLNQLTSKGSESGYIAIDHDLICIRNNNSTFPARVTISDYHSEDQQYYALFIRNLEYQVKIKREIKALNTEATMLRERVNAQQFENIIGESPAILQALEAVGQVAPTETSVLIRGETGTGKELFARAIHNASRRRAKPLVTLNCAALPSELVESELFGHVKGAFTGAMTDREGRFSLADGGTLFLDEIGELPLPLQSKLLRVLQEGEFEPVGSSKTQKVDVRIVAATNRDMEKEIESGKFRQDLYYRLNVFPIQIPPLRERGNDIIMLANAFLEKYSRRSAIPKPELDIASQQKLLSYSWPGNVRELQNIMERCVITSVNGKINVHAIIPETQQDPILIKQSHQTILTEKEWVEMEKQNIIRALHACNWKISGNDGAAALLQIAPTTLNSRMIKMGIKK
jgi:transcriptional regulator with GAF, ATPase, and Fis domain